MGADHQGLGRTRGVTRSRDGAFEVGHIEHDVPDVLHFDAHAQDDGAPAHRRATGRLRVELVAGSGSTSRLPLVFMPGGH